MWDIMWDNMDPTLMVLAFALLVLRVAWKHKVLRRQGSTRERMDDFLCNLCRSQHRIYKASFYMGSFVGAASTSSFISVASTTGAGGGDAVSFSLGSALREELRETVSREPDGEFKHEFAWGSPATRI